jgi:hypothetical protein
MERSLDVTRPVPQPRSMTRGGVAAGAGAVGSLEPGCGVDESRARKEGSRVSRCRSSRACCRALVGGRSGGKGRAYECVAISVVGRGPARICFVCGNVGGIVPRRDGGCHGREGGVGFLWRMFDLELRGCLRRMVRYGSLGHLVRSLTV